MSFTGQVVLITGAGSGIGAATARHFSKLGALLSLTGRNLQNLYQVGYECQVDSGGTEPFLIAGELTKEDDLQYIFDETIKKYGKIDVLINNAGLHGVGSIENTSLAQFDKIMKVNVRSVYHLTMLAVPYLIKTQGNIVNVSSVHGLRSFPDELAYCISKAALDQMTRCTALELAPKQVRVNAVNPGITETNLQRHGGMDEFVYRDFLVWSKQTHALQRVGKPEEVAEAIAFLASSSASNITGVCLSVDGGRHAMCPR